MSRVIFLLLMSIAVPVLAADRPSWQQEWEQVLAAAKREGKVAVIGPREVQARDVLTEPFQKKYGIPVDYFGASGREVSPRLSAERRAARYIWDVYVGGTTTGLTAMIPVGAIDPMEPALILPEVKDPKHWRGGSLDFADPGRRHLVFSPFQRGILFINPNLVRPDAFKSYKDLLNPKWKGKIVMDDPRKAGPGLATFTLFYLHPQLGADFIRALGRQEPTILRDYIQEIDQVAQGRYPILIGTSDATAEYRIRQGVPLHIVDPRQLKEGSDVSPANGAIALMNRAPRSNAAKVYINWLLSKEGQTTFVRAMGYVSARLDVPTDHVPAWRIPQPGAVKTYTQEAMEAKDKVVELLQEVFGR